MKISIIQMDMRFCDPAYNFTHAKELIGDAAAEKPDVIVLPETWNTGFFPTEQLEILCDHDARQVKNELGALAKELKINIVAGSVTNLRNNRLYNTATVFDRGGSCVLEYDKAHLFTMMGEDDYFGAGDRVPAVFTLDGIRCGLAICYDIRFPEFIRTVALQNVDVFFLVSQWPSIRIPQLNTLIEARALENQMFLVCCNSCGSAEGKDYGGNSSLIDPLGQVIQRAGNREEILTGDLDFANLQNLRSSMNVFKDRRPALYDLGK